MVKGWVDVTIQPLEMKRFEREHTHCINLRIALVPHGNFSGRSNVFPNSMSSADCGTKNRPEIASVCSLEHIACLTEAVKLECSTPCTCILHVIPALSSLLKYSDSRTHPFSSVIPLM